MDVLRLSHIRPRYRLISIRLYQCSFYKYVVTMVLARRELISLVGLLFIIIYKLILRRP